MLREFIDELSSFLAKLGEHLHGESAPLGLYGITSTLAGMICEWVDDLVRIKRSVEVILLLALNR